MQPILSTYQGEHNKQGKKNVVRLGFLSGLCAGGVLIALVELWPRGLCLLFGTAGTSSEALSVIALRLYGVAAFLPGSISCFAAIIRPVKMRNRPFC